MEHLFIGLTSAAALFLGYKFHGLCYESRKNSIIIKETFDDLKDIDITNDRHFIAMMGRLESLEDKLNMMALFQENTSMVSPVKTKAIRSRTEQQKESTSKKMKEWWASRKKDKSTTHTIKLSPTEIHSDEKAL